MMYIFRYSTTFRIWQCIYFLEYLVYIMESYVIRCPEQAEWNIRAEIQCQNTRKYFCLYNYVPYSYEEGCTGPDWDRPGSKRVYSRNFNRAPCNDTRYQPIKFVTNGNSDCIFRKSLCTEEGQTLLEAGTTKTDSTCRCDYKQGYAFVTVPRNKCYCRPSEEDCSCYLKKCQEIGYYLSADYECTKNGTKKTVCSLMSENPSEDPHIDMVPPGTPRKDDSYVKKRTYDVAILVSICLFVMIVIAMYIMLQQRLLRCPCLSTEQAVEEDIESGRNGAGPSLDTTDQNATSDHSADGNRLEEIVSGNNEDNQIASSDKTWKSEVDKLKDNICNKGLETAMKQFNEDLDNWKNEPVQLAVTGKSGVGKSSFINAIRNLKSDNPDFATSSGSGNTTTKPTIYEYPGNPNITLHDLPGFGTMELPTNEYKKRMKLHKYDYILIFVGNIEENDIEIAKTLKEMNKPFCFVRSKIDIDILNAEKDGESKIEIVEKIMSKFSGNLKHAGLNKAKFFVISNHNRRIYQFNNLVSYIESNLPVSKYEAFMFSLMGELSVDEIESKYQILKDRILKVSVASGSLSSAPVSGMDMVINMALLSKELLLYHKTFGFEQQCVKDILKDDYIRQKLNVSSIIEIQPTNEAMHTFAKNALKKLTSSEERESLNNLLPSIASVVSEWPAGGDTLRLLIQVLNDCRDDAKLVYTHLPSVDVEEHSTSTTDGDITL